MRGAYSRPPARRRLRLGIVGGGGYGLVGPWHWNGIRLSNRWDLVAGVLSSDAQRARQYGAEWLLPADRVYGDYREMAQRESERADGIEAVALCTPNWLHRPMAEAFLDAGIDILCETPLALSREDCEALLRRQRETGLVFAVAHPYPYHPMVRQAREMIRDGAIGALRQALVEYAQEDSTAPDDPQSKTVAWRRDPAKVGRASATGDIGTHALQMIEFVCGQRVTRLRADFHVCGAPKPMEDTAFLGLRFANGAPGMMWISQAAPGNYCGLRFRAYGDRGGLQWDQEDPERLKYTPLQQPEQVFVRGQGAGVVPASARMTLLPRGHGEALPDAWGHLYAELALAVAARRNRESLPDGGLQLPDIHTGVRGVAFVHAAADSHAAGGVWVPLP